MTLPPSELRAAIEAAHAAFLGDGGGEVAGYIPELASIDPGQFAIALCTPDGQVLSVGDVETPFTLQSISKPFVYALALEQQGLEAVHRTVGVEPTGDVFDSIIQLEEGTNRPQNPMINAGAIATTSLIQGGSRSEKLSRILTSVATFAGRESMSLDTSAFLSERSSGHRNRAMAHLMQHFGMLGSSAEEALELYFQQCAIQVDVRDLAVMAATLASGGVNPITSRRALSSEHTACVLSLMSSCGLYDASGEFLLRTGLFAKSGVCGGILAVSRGGIGLATWSPPLDALGNSVRGLQALSMISERLSLHVHRAAPPGEADPPARRTDPALLARTLDEALESAREVQEGEVARYIPLLAKADPELLAVAVVDLDGQELSAGDTEVPFTIQSAVNPLSYLVALEHHGLDAVHRKVGMEASGNPYNAIRFDPRKRRPFNPLVNSGAIAVASLIPGGGRSEQLKAILEAMNRADGTRRLQVDVPVLMEERAASDKNLAIAHLLRNFDLIERPEAALELFLAQCSISLDVRSLARIAATLAAGGRNPVTGEQVFDPRCVSWALSMMTTCGLNNGSGQFGFHVGLPAKSGVSGCILAVAPGRMGLAVHSPPVDSNGNSVRGVRILSHLARALDLSVFSLP